MTVDASSLRLAKRPHSAFRKLMESETRVAWRVPIGLILGVAVPVLLILIFGNVPGMNHPVKRLGGLSYFNVYFPVLIAFSVAVLSLISLPTHLASYREQGILRRMATTPVPPTWMLAAQVIINLALAVVALGILVAAGTAAFGLGAPKQAGGFALAVVLTIASMFSIGLWVSAIARTAAGAGGIGQLILFPSLFLAGLWVPRQVMAPILRDIGNATPLGAAVQALQSSMQGTFPSAESILVMLGFTIVFGFLAVHFFRWE
jgi:ABC-2 type transport system permease protein